MLITPEHQELQEKYQKLVLRVYQHDQIVQAKDEAIEQLKAQITPLRNANEEILTLARQQQEQITSLLDIVKEKDKQLQKLELMEHQYAEVIEACSTNDGQKIESYTKLKSEKKKHPGRNEIPAHIERKYIDMHPENLPEEAEHFDTIETEQLEYDPARLFATVYRRYKYKHNKPDGSTEFFIASLPEEKDKSLAAPSLKAHVTTEKYMYHMPIYGKCKSSHITVLFFLRIRLVTGSTEPAAVLQQSTMRCEQTLFTPHRVT